MRRITHKDIGLHLGVHQCTVSRALRADPRIPQKLRDEIQRASEELGYRPNPRLSELADARWNEGRATAQPVIAYINSSSSHQIAGPISIEAMSGQAARLGYRVETFHRGEFASSAKLQRVLRNRGITELIIGPAFDESHTIELDWKKFICVQVLPALFQLPLHSVVRDNFNSVLLAWGKAVARGTRKIGITMVRHATKVPLLDDLIRASAVHACQRELYPDLPCIPPLRLGESFYEDQNLFAAWFREHQPDVVIGFNEGIVDFLPKAKALPKPEFFSLHKHERAGCPGILDDIDLCAKEAVKLLHFCRRTYQWGIPEYRIDHVIEPSWFEGDMPLKVRH